MTHAMTMYRQEISFIVMTMFVVLIDGIAHIVIKHETDTLQVATYLFVLFLVCPENNQGQ